MSTIKMKPMWEKKVYMNARTEVNQAKPEEVLRLIEPTIKEKTTESKFIKTMNDRVDKRNKLRQSLRKRTGGRHKRGRNQKK